MGLPTSRGAIIYAGTGGGSGAQERISSYKTGRVAGALVTFGLVARPHTMWYLDGRRGGAGAVAGTTVAIPTRATTGAIGQSNPGGSRQKWLLNYTIWEADAVRGVWGLYDRLAHVSGLSGIVTSAQTFTGGNLVIDRWNASAAEYQGNRIYAEITGLIGATPTTATVSYDNENGVTHTSQAVTFGGTSFREVYRCIEFPLASGDRGVSLVRSCTVLASTGTAGNFSIVIARPLFDDAARGVNVAGVQRSMVFSPGAVEIKSNACLYWQNLSPITTAIPIHWHAMLGTVEL